MEYQDFYQILGVKRDASSDEIKKSYRRLARKYHPDVSQEPDAEARFKEISQAYEVLQDADKRRAYDQLGHQWQAGQNFRPPPDWNNRFQFNGNLDDMVDMGDLFGSLFGQGGFANSGFAGAAGFQQRAAQAPQAQHIKLDISLEESFQGATRLLNLTLPERDGSGVVRNRSKRLNVKIPQGTLAGQQIRLSGQGAGGQSDLFLDVVFREHPWFRADGQDIYLDVPITPWEAALGQSITVPTLGGKVDIKIPAGTKSGAKLRLKGRGLPAAKGTGNAGDQYLVLKLVTPPADTEQAQAFYQRMAEELPMNPRADFMG